MSNPLRELGEHGQSVWLDNISRELVTTDQLEKLIEGSNVTGMTSNPTIFEKAIAHSDDYDQQIHELIEAGVSNPNEIFFGLAISDIQRAADALRPIWERSKGDDGYVSLEVLPSLAQDTEQTIALVDDLWERVSRPNLMIKIPATREGIPAIEHSLAAGHNINITLIFALEMYEQVVNAYLNALEQRQRQGLSLDVHSVASFFVSRVDTAVDKLLEEKLARSPGDAKLEGLLGKAAIANARLAYELFEKNFIHGERFAALAKDGASVQRPLWASTSAKNPNYRDVLYAEALVGPHTVDTMPLATIEAFGDHGVVEGDTVNLDYDQQRSYLRELREVGIDIDDVTQQLLDDGLRLFGDSYDQLIDVLATKVDAFCGKWSERFEFVQGNDTTLLLESMKEHHAIDVASRVWQRDPNLWKPNDAAHAKVIGNRLGWLDVIDKMRPEVGRLRKLADDVKAEGVADVVLLGMGGSSLCPEVLRTSFGQQPGYPTLHVLDTTDPVAIDTLTKALDPHKSWFIVSSKSGGTLETLSHFAHFWEFLEKAGISQPGQHFVTVTDPGSGLAKSAQEHKFREIFLNPADIGGRYSALSFFGLVPAALAGIDVAVLLERAAQMRTVCAAGMPEKINVGLSLGAAMAHFHAHGRDKVTILAPQKIAAFSLWAEQLIAESTGKEGKGIIPIGAEPLGMPDVYSEDRLFVVLSLPDAEADFTRRVAALIDAGHPVVALQLNDLYDLGAEFFRWEFATAVAGSALQIDPFDEPNVQESKDNTKKVLAEFEKVGKLPEQPAVTTDQLREFLDKTQTGDYVAIMAYVTPDAAYEAALQAFRTEIRDAQGVATTLGFGPRFLHSTGQLHKGGPNSGVFIQITCDDTVDVPIPDQDFTFSTLKQAQAAGDLQSLGDHGRRVVRVHLGGDPLGELQRLTESVRAAGATR